LPLLRLRHLLHELRACAALKASRIHPVGSRRPAYIFRSGFPISCCSAKGGHSNQAAKHTCKVPGTSVRWTMRANLEALHNAASRRRRTSSYALAANPAGAKKSRNKRIEIASAAQCPCAKGMPPIPFVSKFEYPFDYSDTLLVPALRCRGYSARRSRENESGMRRSLWKRKGWRR
jgi:hypothetical protein